MEKKLKTIEYELTQTEKRLEDLLVGIKQLRKEVSDMLPPKVKKAMTERVVINRSDLFNDIKIDLTKCLHFLSQDYKVVNIIRYSDETVKKYVYDNLQYVMLSTCTRKKEVIITYIPSINTVYVVER